MAVSPSRFEEQMAVLARLTRPLRLCDVPRVLAADRYPNAVVVTFDDGYADNLQTALPVLERFGIPATLFMVSGYLGREFWWDELDRLEDAPDATAAETELPSATDDQRRLTLDRLAAGGNRSSRAPRYRSVTAEELRAVATSRLIDIGAHGATHRMLPALSLDEQRRELRESRIALEAIVDRAVSCFSYPHGAFSRATASLVQQAGYSVACCSTPDVVSVRCDLLALPRFWVQDWSADRFESFLRRWLGA